MGYLMMRAELDGIVCSGPRRGNQFTYALLDERVPPTARARPRGGAGLARASLLLEPRPGHRSGFREVVRDDRDRCEEGSRSRQRAARLRDCRWQDLLVRTLDQTNGKATSTDRALLSIYDEYVSGYKDRSAIVSARNGARLVAMGNALTSIVVVNGQITGTWKRRVEKGTAVITIELFDRLTKAEHQALEAAVQAYGDFLGMPAAQE